MRIPSEKALTLSGLNVTVPDDFTGERNALLIAFERAHLIAFPAWRAALKDALAADPDLGFYALALIGPVPRWQQRVTQWALKLETTGDFAREHTALLAQDQATWAHRIGLVDTSAPVLIICGQDGEVHSVADGPPRAVTAKAAVKALLM